jgi:hypothetical protein
MVALSFYHKKYNGNFFSLLLALWCSVVILIVIIHASDADADTGCHYCRLQVLVPGESPAPCTESGKTGTPLVQTVGVPFRLRVRACDDYWRLSTEINHVVALECTDSSAELPSSVSLSDGEAELTVTLNSTGTFTVTAADLTTSIYLEGVSSQIPVIEAESLKGFTFSEIPEDLTAGVPFDVTITAVDGLGEIFTEFSDQVRMREITSSGDGRIEPEVICLEDGVWTGTVTVYLADITTTQEGNGNALLMALLPGDSSRRGTSTTFIVHPGDYSRLQIILPGQVPDPGTISGISGSVATQVAGCSFPVVIKATDEYWNPLELLGCPGIKVGVESSDPASPVQTQFNMTAPVDTFFMVMASPGVHTISVSDLNNASITGMTSVGIDVIDVEPDFIIHQIPSPVTAGDSVGVIIHVVDSRGDPILEYNGQAILASSTGPGSFGPEHILFSGGYWSGNMLFRTAANGVTVSCFDYSSPPNVGTSEPFDVIPAELVGLQLLLPGESPQGGLNPPVAGSPTVQTAGTEFYVTVRAVDRFWNMVSGVNDSIEVEWDDEFGEAPAGILLDDGRVDVPVVNFRAGTHRLFVTDLDSGEVNSYLSSPVDVGPGPFSKIISILPGQQLEPGSEIGRSGMALDQSINYMFTVRVLATDSWWNAVSGVSDVVSLSSTDGLAELPPDTPLLDGAAVLQVRLGTGGYQQLVLSDISSPEIPENTNQLRMINSGFHIEAEISPDVVVAGEPFTLTAEVTNDAGAVMQEVNSTAMISVRNSSTGIEGRGILLGNKLKFKQGRCSVTQTYTAAEPIILEILSDYTEEPGITNTLIVKPGSPAEIGVSSPEWLGGRKRTGITAKVADRFGNGVAGQPVTFDLIEGHGTISETDTVTDGAGIARAEFRSPGNPETSVIRATSNRLIAEVEIETALVDPGLPGGTITNYPNPFHPDEGSTTVAYKLSTDANVSLKIFTLNGNLVLCKTFASGRTGGMEGLNEFSWDGCNGDGRIVSSGGYIAVLQAESRSGTTIHTMRRRIAVVR